MPDSPWVGELIGELTVAHASALEGVTRHYMQLPTTRHRAAVQQQLAVPVRRPQLLLEYLLNRRSHRITLITRNISDNDQSNYSLRIILSHIPAKLLS